MTRSDDPATTDAATTDPFPPARPPAPPPSPSDTTEGRRRFADWADRPPVRVGWIADAKQEILDATGRLHVFVADGLRRVAARRAGESLMEAVDWMAPRCAVLVYVTDGDGAGDSLVYDLVRPVNPLRLSHDAGEDEGEDMADRAVDEGRAVVASGSRGGDFARSPACESLLRTIEEEFQRPVEVLVGGFVHDDSLAASVDGLLARGHRVTVVRDATSFPARKPLRRPPPGWAGDGAVRSVADLRASWGGFRQGSFADQEIEDAHERMESLARRSPRFSPLHILDESVPWELYRARLEGPRTFPNNLALADEALTDDALVTWKWRKVGYGLPGLERLTGPSPADSGGSEDGGLDKAGLRPGPRAVSTVSRGSKRRSQRRRKKKRKRRKKK